MSRGDAEAIIGVALESAAPVEVDPAKYYVVSVPSDGSVDVIKPAPDAELANPRRVKGTSKVLDVDSFAHLYEKHAVATSEVFADPSGFAVTGILDADQGAGELAGHRAHRLVLQCVHTPSWLAWLAHDGQYMTQVEFAEFIEDNVIDVTDPSGADMLELAQTIESNQSVRFKSGFNLGSGVRTVQFEETAANRAGQTGQMEIPTQIRLALQPFERGDRFNVTARFRLRIREGVLRLGYKLDRPEDVVRTAFEDVAQKVSEATGTTVAIGTPPGAVG